MTLLNAIRNHGTIWGASTEPFWCEVGAVGKVNDKHRHVVANEFICCRLAELAGIPAAHGAVLSRDVVGDEGPVYLSFLAFAGNDEPAPPTTGVIARKPALCAAAVVFDCWVMNEDRHRENVVFAPELKVPFTLIDFEGALRANDRDVTDRRYLDDHLVGGQLCPWVTSDTDLDRWADQIREVPASAVQRVTSEAASLGLMEKWEVDQVFEALIYRQRRLPQYMRDARDDGRLPRVTGPRRLGI